MNNREFKREVLKPSSDWEKFGHTINMLNGRITSPENSGERRSWVGQTLGKVATALEILKPRNY